MLGTFLVSIDSGSHGDNGETPEGSSIQQRATISQNPSTQGSPWLIVRARGRGSNCSVRTDAVNGNRRIEMMGNHTLN